MKKKAPSQSTLTMSPRLTRSDQTRLLKAAQQIPMDKEAAISFIEERYHRKWISIPSSEVSKVVEVFHLMAERERVKERCERINQEIARRKEQERQEELIAMKRAEVRAAREARQSRINRQKKAAKYERLGKEARP